MNLNKIINYALILIGSVIAIYAQAEEEQNVFILVVGIVLLMLGIYRISRTIPSKFDSESNNQDIDDEENI